VRATALLSATHNRDEQRYRVDILSSNCAAKVSRRAGRVIKQRPGEPLRGFRPTHNAAQIPGQFARKLLLGDAGDFHGRAGAGNENGNSFVRDIAGSGP